MRTTSQTHRASRRWLHPALVAAALVVVCFGSGDGSATIVVDPHEADDDCPATMASMQA